MKKYELLSWRKKELFQCILCLQMFIMVAMGDVGTAASYASPYIPTQCWGYDQTGFPADNMFVSVGERVWDNGAACGRRYRVRCIGGEGRPCRRGFVDVTVVDMCQSFPCTSTFLFSTDAFSKISRNSDATISIEYFQI